MQDLQTFWDYRDPYAYIDLKTDYHSYVPATLLARLDGVEDPQLVVARQEKMVLITMTKDGNPYGDPRLRIGLLNDRMDLIEGVLHGTDNNIDRGDFIVRRRQD
jgi:hypothetical protein